MVGVPSSANARGPVDLEDPMRGPPSERYRMKIEH
jgi:hypothetical protein